ncbi:MAG: 3-deoxy-manno-octulosonate cytidylyltransferase [Oligoflexia bacterium]|nr:3-deoxy-manno-octulosonate cytidylyltransferase [Oligoflexia bacterium]
MRAIAVIPSRFGSQRLPGKPLADIHGRPMLAWVVDRCRAARRVERVVVATDDRRIALAAKAAGAQAVMTSSHHKSGSDRVAEVVRGLGLSPEQPIINVQGDEPLVDPATIDAVLEALDDPAVDVATAAAPLLGDPTDASRVKVVVDCHNRALYFSRAPIPAGGPYRVHLGIYAFRVRALLAFAALPQGDLERLERLEQLRMIEHRVSIQVVPADRALPAVDTRADLDAVRSILAQRS